MIIHVLFLLLVFCAPALALELPEEHTTPAGIKFWHLEDKTTPSAAISFAFKGGSEEDPETKQGLAYIMADMLTEGTDRLDAPAFQRELNDHNIAFSVSAGREAVNGKLFFLLRHKDKAAALAHDALASPAFRNEDLDRSIKTALAALKQNITDPDWRAQRVLMQQIFAGTSYAQASRGLPETLPHITPADLINAKARHLTRARLVIATVGDIGAEGMGKIIDSIFADLPHGTPWQAKPLQLTHRGETWYNAWQGSQQDTILFAAPSIGPADPDYPAALIANDILGGGGFRAALMDELRQNLGATYGASTAISNLEAAPLLMGQSAVIADKTDEAKSIIETVWRNAEHHMTAERIHGSVTYLSGSLTNDLTSSTAISGYYLALQMADLPPDTVIRLPEQLRAVTKSDISRVLQRHYDPADISYVIVGPQKPARMDRAIDNLWTMQ